MQLRAAERSYLPKVPDETELHLTAGMQLKQAALHVTGLLLLSHISYAFMQVC